MGDLKGFSLCRRGPELTHLLFADDSMLFCRATPNECRNIIDILESYEKAFGQKVNKNKTSIFINKSTLDSTKQEIKNALGVQEIVQYEQYLGLPSLVRKKKVSISSKKRFGESYKDGRENCCHKQGVKF